MRIAVDGQPIEYSAGDSVAVAIVRAGQHPQHGGTLCLAGDCGNCCAEIDGIAFTRTCLTPALPGMRVIRHPAVGGPPLRMNPPVDPVMSPAHGTIDLRREHADLVVIGAGDSGRAAADAARANGRGVITLAGDLGHDVVGVYPGPLVVARLDNGDMLHIHAHDVVIATGAAELLPVCEGNMLRGIYTAQAADKLQAAGVDLGLVATLDLPQLIRIEGNDGHVTGVVTTDGSSTPCESVVVTSKLRAPRDLL